MTTDKLNWMEHKKEPGGFYIAAWYDEEFHIQQRYTTGLWDAWLDVVGMNPDEDGYLILNVTLEEAKAECQKFSDEEAVAWKSGTLVGITTPAYEFELN